MLKAGGNMQMKKRMISLLLGLGLLCSVAACGQTNTGRATFRHGERNGICRRQRGANAKRNFACHTDAGTDCADHTNTCAGKNTKTGKDNKGNGKAESNQKSNGQTESDEKAAKQCGFFCNGVHYGHGKEISQSGV